MRHILHLIDAQRGHMAWCAAWKELRPWLMAGHRFEVTIRQERRTTAQNSMLWALLTDVSRQVVWHGLNLSPEDFKHIFSSALKKQRVAPGLDGGFVVLGQSTSQMSKAELSELIELVLAFGAERGVKWTEQREVAPEA
jgi:hypothetical protein